MRRGLPCTASNSPAGSLEHEAVLERAQVGARLAARRLLGPGQRDGALGALLVGLVDTAAVAGLEPDALVVVAHHGGDGALAQQRGDLVGKGAIADEVTQADHVGHAASLDVGEDRLEAGKVAVHI